MPSKQTKHTIVFPTYGYLSPNQKNWVVPLKTWSYAQKTNPKFQRVAARMFLNSLSIKMTDSYGKNFRERAKLFFVDNLDSNEVRVHINQERYALGTTRSNGFLEKTIRIPVGEVPQEGESISLRAKADPKSRLPKVPNLTLLAPQGISVVSDIDDTIKKSDVSDKKKLLSNTFLREFRAVPGMARHYRQLEKMGASFHYVSTSPWQLYPALQKFMDECGFPRGTFHLRRFRVKDRSLLKIFDSPREHKIEIIQSLLNHFPKRKFLFFGDSGEEDPEIYAELFSKHPKQIERIFFREVLDRPIDSKRRASLVSTLGRNKAGLTVFRRASDLK